MRFTIQSRKLGKAVEFSRPGAGYIYVDLNGKPGTLGEQICDGGSVFGSTITYHRSDQKGFERVCSRWWKAYLKRRKFILDMEIKEADSD